MDADTNLVASFYLFRFEPNALRHLENLSPTLLQSTSLTFNARLRQTKNGNKAACVASAIRSACILLPTLRTSKVDKTIARIHQIVVFGEAVYISLPDRSADMDEALFSAVQMQSLISIELFRMNIYS
jgi:hypothetical protein